MNIVLDWRADGDSGWARLRAMGDDGPLHRDRLRVDSAASRTRFVADLLAKCPALDTPEQRAALEKEMLDIADKMEVSSSATPKSDAPEIELTRIVRPELFHTEHASGVAIPCTRLLDGKPVGDWALYCRWHAHGERERRELASCIDLPAGGNLWVHPMPADPTPTMRSGWSARGRAAWLAGADAPDPVETWKRVCERFTQFIDFPPDVAAGTVATLSLWTMFTYIYPCWTAVPYLSFGGPLGSGKTQAFHVIRRLAFRPVESSNLTGPAIFRTLHECGGVLLLDEAERLRENAPDAGELRAILLSGYKAGSPAIRLEKEGDSFRRVEFDVFGPKAMAAISNLPEALASRCIRIGMFRAGPDSPKPRRRMDANPAIWAELRDNLHALALEHGPAWLACADRADVCPAGIGGRDFELWQPLLALAAWIDERGASGLLGVVRDFAEHAVDAGRDESISEADELLLRKLAAHVVAGTHRTIKPSGLLDEARAADATTFGKWSGRGVAAALKRYGLRTHKTMGEKFYGRVTIESLRRVSVAYGFDLALPETTCPTYPTCPTCPETAETPDGDSQSDASVP